VRVRPHAFTPVLARARVRVNKTNDVLGSLSRSRGGRGQVPYVLSDNTVDAFFLASMITDTTHDDDADSC
jgi:hypothetical protein